MSAASMPGRQDRRRPSQVTGDYWVHASAPDHREQYAAGEGRSGKWLVYVPVARLDAWWELVRDATWRGDLGASAKAATARPNELQASPGNRLICVYTGDWQNLSDVRRVLGAVRDLGVSWRLPYKTDAATSAGVYGRGVSLYVSPPGSRDFSARAGRLTRTA
jgi:hypothetical protein